MSGAQGAQPPGCRTATTYESVEGGENRTRTDISGHEDQGKIQIETLQEKVEEPVGEGGPVFGSGSEEDDKGADLGVTGTG